MEMKEVKEPEDMIAKKAQGHDDNEEPKDAKKSTDQTGDNDSIATTIVKKRKAVEDAADMAQAPNTKKYETTVDKIINQSERSPLLDRRLESVTDYTTSQELHSITDESINKIVRTENDCEAKLGNNKTDLELLNWNEMFEGNGDDLEYSYTKIIMRQGPLFLYSKTTTRQNTYTQIDLARLESRPIPRIHIYPILPTRAPDPLPPHAFLKRPSLIPYAESRCLTEVSALFMREAQMCEMIKRSPHLNVVTYFGCVVDADGRISELCFARYRKTLAEMVKDGEVFDRKACLDNIRAGIEHLHSLGMIHCDINPSNVLVDEENFVIGDFDSCALEGDELGTKAGTFGWTSDDFVLAQRENDWFGLAKIEEFLFPPKVQ